MKVQSFNTFKHLANQSAYVSVCLEKKLENKPNERISIELLLQAFKAQLSQAVVLETQQEKGQSEILIAFNEKQSVELKQGRLQINKGGQVEKASTSKLRALSRFVEELKISMEDKHLGRAMHLVGLMAYDAVRYVEAIPDKHQSDANYPEMMVKCYQTLVRFNPSTQRISLYYLVEVHEDLKRCYLEATDALHEHLNEIEEKLHLAPCFIPSETLDSLTRVEPSDDDYLRQVKAAQEYIRNGEVFQVVLSRVFQKETALTPLEFYLTLRNQCPAPYLFMFYVEGDAHVGASPERLVSIQRGEVTVNPIAGTRRREHQCQEEQIEQELLNDAKELAEHRMLVDLARNDLGRVCLPGSVKMKTYLKVKHHSYVSHLVSEVTGKLLPQAHSMDVLQAVFPAGTVSGAPKIRAMQIIDELELSRRGFYGGTLFLMDGAGSLESCLLIRMAKLRGKRVQIRTGAGIVSASNPMAERDETVTKAEGLLGVLQAGAL